MSPAPPTDDELWEQLKAVCYRLNRSKEDQALRADLYEALRDRGFMIKQIAEVAGVRPDAVSWVLNKVRQEREGTWDPTRGGQLSRRRARRAG